MTNEEIIRLCQCAKEAPVSTSAAAYKTLFENVIGSMEKYRWHDIRKCPDELPEDDVWVVLTAIEDPYEHRISYDTFTVDFLKSVAGIPGSAIIAWKYIEPVEVRK